MTHGNELAENLFSVCDQTWSQWKMNSANLFCRSLTLLNTMSRRSRSPPSSPPPQKKPKFDYLTAEDYKNGIFLAPMVRSGAC